MFLDKINRPVAVKSGDIANMLRSPSAGSGSVVTVDTAMRLTAVYACVRVLSESIAQLPLVYYQRNGDRKERATTQKLYTLLHDAPNNFQTSFEWRETNMAHLCLRGRAFSFINRSSGGQILELLPLHPDRIKMTQNKDYSISYVFKDADNIDIDLRQDQVLRLTGMSFDGINGISPIEYQKQVLGISLATDEHTAKSFKNGAKMTGILKHPTTFKDDKVAKRVQESWDDASNGANAYSTPVLEDGMEWMPVSMTNKDAQYIESRKFNIEDVARIYRVPPHKIGHLEKSTNNNIEHQGLEFVTDSMMPWVVRWEQSILRDLLTESERLRYFAEFNVDGLLRGDTTARAAYYTSLRNLGVLTPNDILKKENMNPRTDSGGDEYITPLNMETSGNE